MRRRDGSWLWGVCILLVALAAAGAHAATYHVKLNGTGDFTLIQEAIDVSMDGDEIVVHPGTYYENIQFNGKNSDVRDRPLHAQFVGYGTTSQRRRRRFSGGSLADPSPSCMPLFARR